MKSTIIMTGNPSGTRLYEFPGVATDKDVALWASQFCDLWDGKVNHHEGIPPIRTINIGGEILIIKENGDNDPVIVYFGYDHAMRSFSYRIMRGDTLIHSGGSHGTFDRISTVFEMEKEIAAKEESRWFFVTGPEVVTLLTALCDKKTVVLEKVWRNEKQI